jgi:hypothetical protein
MVRYQFERTFLGWMLLFAPVVVGCQGCREDAEPKVGSAPAAAIISKDLKSLPADDKPDQFLLKPGHWTSTSQAWQSNTEDVRCLLVVSPSVGNREGNTLESVRPAVLPKGQSKQLDCRILVPLGPPGERKSVDVRSQLAASNEATIFESINPLAKSMGPHEYFFAVLSKRPEQFTVLQVSDWVRPPKLEFSDATTIDFRVVFPTGEGLLPIPDTIFEWTSTSYLLWDDMTAEQLTLDQRQALRDWIYWGGQLVINGPASAEGLLNSDLADLLPIESPRGVGLEPNRLMEMVTSHSVATDSSTSTVNALLSGSSERIGISGEAKGDAVHVPGTSDLVVERRVGRGRVSMTRFDLSSSWMLKWNSLQSFYNNVLLRRPPRTYEKVEGDAVLVHAGDLRLQSNDPRLNTGFRLFARDGRLTDLGQPLESISNSEKQGAASSESEVTKRESQPRKMPATSWMVPGESFKPGEGIATWTDQSDTSMLIKQLLQEEAGIDIPSVNFVAKSLAIYLLILVPINYIVFWLLGRLEWAWVMVPIIGLTGAAWIARSARLDIGFARSTTEIDLLEMHAGHPRAHTSRYVAIYNSLSTNYEIKFASREAVAAPLGVFGETRNGQACQFRQAFDDTVSLTNLAIPSNQTSTIHAEQMIDVGGAFVVAAEESLWDGNWELRNQSELTIFDAVVIGRTPEGKLVYDSPGMIEPGEAAKIRVREGVAKISDALPLSVDRILSPMLNGDWLAAGQMALVGRIEQTLDGLEIVPPVSQANSQTVAIIHLTAQPLPDVATDQNLRTDIKTLSDDEDLDL